MIGCKFVDWLLLGPLSFGSNKSWRYSLAYWWCTERNPEDQ